MMMSWCHGELQVHEAYSKWWKIKVAESEILSRHFGEKLTISNLHTAPQVGKQYIFVICTLVFNLLICLFICRLPCELVLYHPLNLASVSCMWFTADCGSLFPSLRHNFNNWICSTCQQLNVLNLSTIGFSTSRNECVCWSASLFCLSSRFSPAVLTKQVEVYNLHCLLLPLSIKTGFLCQMADWRWQGCW